MVPLRIRDLIDLVASGVPNPESRLEKVHDWSHARYLELAKWLLAFAAALFAPLVVAYAKGEIGRSSSPRWMAATVFLAVAVAAGGASMLMRIRQRYRIYLAAQALLGELQKVAPFLARYRHGRRTP